MDYREKLGKESEWGRARENDFGSPYGIFVNPLLYRSMRYHTQKSIEILHIIRNWWKGVWKIRWDTGKKNAKKSITIPVSCKLTERNDSILRYQRIGLRLVCVYMFQNWKHFRVREWISNSFFSSSFLILPNIHIHIGCVSYSKWH